jgi:hypothetical protein
VGAYVQAGREIHLSCSSSSLLNCPTCLFLLYLLWIWYAWSRLLIPSNRKMVLLNITAPLFKISKTFTLMLVSDPFVSEGLIRYRWLRSGPSSIGGTTQLVHTESRALYHQAPTDYTVGNGEFSLYCQYNDFYVSHVKILSSEPSVSASTVAD